MNLELAASAYIIGNVSASVNVTCFSITKMVLCLYIRKSESMVRVLRLLPVGAGDKLSHWQKEAPFLNMQSVYIVVVVHSCLWR